MSYRALTVVVSHLVGVLLALASTRAIAQEDPLAPVVSTTRACPTQASRPAASAEHAASQDRNIVPTAEVHSPGIGPSPPTCQVF